MINNSALRTIYRTAKDIVAVAEIYSADTTPTADGFDPEDALLCVARVGGINFRGVEYKRLVRSFGAIKRTVTPEINNTNIDFSNLTREISDFEFETGFEGLILVVRLLSRSRSVELSDTQILFAGKCEQGKNGSTERLSVAVNFILGSLDVEMPRRKFVAEDHAGRLPDNKLFEGFLFMPQGGVITYSTRERRTDFLGIFGFKKTVKNTLPWSSHSDYDANQNLPEVFGRWQMKGIHIGYGDTGPQIRMNVAFCEGEISGYANTRSANLNLPLSPTSFAPLTGKLGGVGDQVPDPLWMAPGYYSRTAYIRCQADNSEVGVDEPAPDVVSIVLGRLILTPTAEGVWNVTAWTDNPAAIARFPLQSEDYGKLHANWFDDESFFVAYQYNDEILFDISLSDFLFVPDSGSFTNLVSDGNNYFLPTSSITPTYFKYLKGDATVEETFARGARSFEYDNTSGIIPIDPDDFPPVDGGGETPTLTYFLRRRYTANIGVTDTIKVIDFLHQVIFPASRMFLTQGANGKLKLNHKKPVSWGLGTTEFEAGDDTIALDDISDWIDNLTGYALIDPHTMQSEVREVIEANYDEAQNDVDLSASANITVEGFGGCDGAQNPATATLLVTDTNEDLESSFTLDGIEISFIAGTDDTLATVAGFIYASINAHPVLRRKFRAIWSASSESVLIVAKFGSLTLASELENDHAAPLDSPEDAPVLAAMAGGSLPAGWYYVAYAFITERGRTLLSPYAAVELDVDEKIDVDAVTVPAGATVVWYVVPAAHSIKLREHSQNDGSAFEIDELPSLNAGLPPDLNRTGCEVMRVAAVFSDRQLSRSNAMRSNVLDATFEFMGERRKVVNEVRLKFRDATQDFRQVPLHLQNEAHIAKTGKVSHIEINGQAIDNFNQAYRIAAGILAEYRDADFPYKWASTREALLLEEGDVVAVTDNSSGVINLPVRIETINLDLATQLPKANFTAWKYTTTLHDDSAAERVIPVLIEN